MLTLPIRTGPLEVVIGCECLANPVSYLVRELSSSRLVYFNDTGREREQTADLMADS